MTLQQIYEQNQEALKSRKPWENKLAKMESQRFCLDRSRVNNSKWPRCSNVRYPLSGIIIDQQKPFLYKVIHSQERVATFRPLISANTEYSLGCEGFFDFQTRELTNFEEEIQFCLDGGLQDGEAYVKIMWNKDTQSWHIFQIDPLFVIAPADCEKFDESPWITHVLVLSPEVVLKRFNDVPDIEGFVKRNKGKEGESDDEGADRQEDRYERQGITDPPKDMIVLWERHYTVDGKRRMLTTSPSEPSFDLQDDRAYPYAFADKHRMYMIMQWRREMLSKNLHSSRGIPELVQEGEFVLTSAWRNWQDYETLSGNPTYEAPNGIPGSAQNIKLTPGQIAPFALRLIAQPPPPVDWQAQMAFTREIYERYAATPDTGIGAGNTFKDSRTATEVNKISNIQGLNAELMTGNWKAFIRKIFKAAWSLNVQYKPESLNYYLDNELQALNPVALNDDYQIVVSGSADMIDKEFVLTKYVNIYKLMMGNPNANMSEVTKAIFEVAFPGQSQRFWMDTQQRQMDNMLKAADDVSIILSTGVEVKPEHGEDFATNAMTALSILNNKAQTGQALTPVQVQLVTQYISMNREALKKTNKQAYDQLGQQLNQIDMQMHQNLAATRVFPSGGGAATAPASSSPSPALFRPRMAV